MMTTTAATIWQYADSAGIDDASAEELSCAEFADWSIDKHCGQECVKIIDAAKPLLAIVDPLAKPDVWQAVIRAMSIICLG